MSYSLHDLRSIPEERLITEHDQIAQHTSVGVQYYLDELARRDATKLAEKTEGATEEMRKLTRVITVLTVVNVVLVLVSLLNS